jgi:hypothetical protein
VLCKVKAAPADEARAVRHSRRREAPTLEVLKEGFAVDARAAPQSSAPWTGRSKLARANSWVILPEAQTARTARAGKGRSLRIEHDGPHSVQTEYDAVIGPRARC